jgi:ABC-2 type transport system permease protein
MGGAIFQEKLYVQEGVGMRKTLEITRYELVSALKRPSYIVIAFGIPIILVIAFTAYSLIKSNQPEDVGSDQALEDRSLETEGFVDLAGLITIIPNDLPVNKLVRYQNEEDAQKALEAGEITAFYLIPRDYIESGDYLYIHPTINPISEGGQDWIMRWTLYVNMLGGDMETASNIWNPADINLRDLSKEGNEGNNSSGDCITPGYTCESNTLIKLLPIGIMLIIYISIISGGSYLLRLVSSEKDTRVMEILLLSASPNQLLSGKVIGYCLLGLLQVLVWFGAVYLVFMIGGTTINIPSGFKLPISLIGWGLLFFLLGYAVYASLMAGAGALTPKLSQYTSVYFIVSIPLFVSYAFSIILAMRPHSPLAIGLSMFPLSAPVMMITRLTVGGVPIWQPLIAAVLTLLFAFLIIRAVARIFHAQMLLSGQPFSITRFIKALTSSS